MLRDVLADRRRIEGTGHPKGPGERPASLGERHALPIAMQPGTAAGCAAARVRYDKRTSRLPGAGR
ncbi:MAG TPA: hypothetical protein VH373_01810 [Jatrophihabitantaceae bacterium]|jgi:hypothetical protein